MRRYKFSRVFGPETQQEDLYKATAEPMVKGLLEGQNSASPSPAFVHGAVGSAATLVELASRR